MVLNRYVAVYSWIDLEQAERPVKFKIRLNNKRKNPRWVTYRWSITPNEISSIVIGNIAGSLNILARYPADINALLVFLRKMKGMIKKFCSTAQSLETSIYDSMQQNNIETEEDDYLLDDDEEETQLYDGVTIVIDTRQKKNKFNEAIKKGFENLGFRTISTKLPYGDYSRLDTMRITVDTKRGLGEIAKNLCSDDRVRFKEEAKSARKHGIELIVLIIDEHATCIDDVKSWHNPVGQIQGPQLAKTMKTWEERYVHFEFCCHTEASAKILDILGVDYEHER